MKHVTKIFLYVLLLLSYPVVYGQQSNSTINNKESIINFHSDIIIDTTGTIRVTESIRVFAAGHDIKRGIVRTIPIYRTDKYGKKKKTDIDIISVSCNGHAIALGVANKWGKKFTNALEQHNYNPGWYIGSTIFRPYNFATSFPRSFSNTINSASIGASGSGGGFSGGGGGGGGGRGW